MRAFFLVLILVALAGMLFAQRRGQTGLRIPVAVLALLALVISLTFALRPSQPSYVHRLEPFHRSVGYMLGRSVREQSPEVTKLVVLQDRREEPTVRRLTNQQTEGLQEGLGGDDIELVHVNLLDIITTGDPSPDGAAARTAEEPPQRGSRGGPSPHEKFRAVMEAHPEVVTIVSFAGYPNYVRSLVRRDRRYRCYVWDVGTDEAVNWNVELASKRVAARVGPNLTAADMRTDLPRSISMEEIFAMRYELNTAP